MLRRDATPRHQCIALAAILASTELALVAAVDCPRHDTTNVPVLRRSAGELYSAGSEAEGDACLARALSLVTAQLEALATEAESLKAYRAARSVPGSAAAADGCVVDAAGSVVCLPKGTAEACVDTLRSGRDATCAEWAGSGQCDDNPSFMHDKCMLSCDMCEGSAAAAAATAASDVAEALPRSIEACSSGDSAVALLQRVERGEATIPSAGLESGLVHAAHRHWWAAARATVDALRSTNAQVGESIAEHRRASQSIADHRRA